jgi:hypothetical protein
MPAKIVDLSARSEIIRDEPFGLHFWECEPAEYLEFLRDPRGFLAGMGIDLPKDCRIETVIENHDWMSANTNKLRNGGKARTIVCNIGHGNTGITRNIYRIISYGHTHDDIGKFTKRLLHAPEDQEQTPKLRRGKKKR